MNKIFYIVTILVAFIVLIFVMNFIWNGGNEAVRAIFRYAGNNPRVAAISESYRHSLLGESGAKKYEKDRKKKAARKKIRAINDEESTTLQLGPNTYDLPRDHELGRSLDKALSRMYIAGIHGEEVLVTLSYVVNIPIDQFTKIYKDISQATYLLNLPQEQRNNPMVVELYVRRDQIKTQMDARD